MLVLVQACVQTAAGLYSNNRTNLLHFNWIILNKSVVQTLERIGTSGLRDSGLANRTSVLPRKPLLYAVHVIAVATAQLPSFLVYFELFLTDATSPVHFRRKMSGVERGVLYHPKALNDLVLTKPCTYISNPVLKIEQLLICHVVDIEAPILILIINTHSSQ